MGELNHFDVIVVGVGSMGAPTCYYLAAAGAKVLGIEQFDIPHDFGSHGGQTRIIRKAYFEHPDYVPLLQMAYDNWEALERITQEQVFFKTGLLYAGSGGHPVMKGVRFASAAYSIPLEAYASSESNHPLSLPEGHEYIFEPDAGFLLPEKAIRLYTKIARTAGAYILSNTPVLNWKDLGDIFEVHTASGIFYAEKLIFTSGAWTSKLLPSLPVPLQVTRQVLAWVVPSDPAQVTFGRFPCWMVADADFPGCFYGFPVLPQPDFDGLEGFKIAWHQPGIACDPDKVDRLVSVQDEAILVIFLKKYFPGLYARTAHVKTCLYTNSPDEDFIIDFLPGYRKRVVVAAGFSGHGFKFASAIGEMLAEMAMKQTAFAHAGFLSLSRFVSAGQIPS